MINEGGIRMKIHWNNKYVKWGATVIIVFCTCLIFYYILFHGANIKSLMDTLYTILMPICFGGIMAYLLTPTVNWFERRLLEPLTRQFKLEDKTRTKPIMRAVSIIMTALLYYVIIQMLISMLLSQIVPSVQNIISNYDSYVTNFLAWLDKFLSVNTEIEEYVFGLIDKYSAELTTFFYDTILVKSNELIKTVSLSVIGILKVLWNFVLGFIISIYLLASKEKFANQAKKVLYAFFERDKANVVINNFRFAHNTFIGFIIGKVIDSIIIGCLCFGGTSLLQTPYAALVSVIIGITNVIPFFGPFLGAIPCSILILVVDPAHPLNFVYFVIFILVLQQIDGNIIGPKILGDSTGLSSFWVIFAITFFGGIMGIAGMIIGVPLFAIIYAAIKSYVNSALIKKSLPSKTENYTNVECIDDDGFHTFDFINNRKAEQFHSGSKFISSAEEWRYRYQQKKEEAASKENKRNNKESESKEEQ